MKKHHPNTITLHGAAAILTVHFKGAPHRVTIDAEDAGRVSALHWSLHRGAVVSKRSTGGRGVNAVEYLSLAQFVQCEALRLVWRTGETLDYRKKSLSLVQPFKGHRKGNLILNKQEGCQRPSPGWVARVSIAGKMTSRFFAIAKYGGNGARNLAKSALKRMLGKRREKIDPRRLGSFYAARTGLAAGLAVRLADAIMRRGEAFVARLTGGLSGHGARLLAALALATASPWLLETRADSFAAYEGNAEYAGCEVVGGEVSAGWDWEGDER